MGAHHKPEDPSSSPTITRATYDSRGHVGAATRVVVTKPARNWFAFFCLAAALTFLVIPTPILPPLVWISGILGLQSAKTLREGRMVAWAGILFTILVCFARMA